MTLPLRARSLKVLQAIGTVDAVGGAQRLMLDAVSHLDPARVRSDVAYYLGKGELVPRLRAAGCSVFDFTSRPWDPIGLARTTALIRRGGYDVVHCHLSRAEIVGALGAILAEAAGGARVKLILHKHNEDGWWRQGMLALVHRAITARADAVAVLSPRLLDFFGDPALHVWDPARMVVLSPGIDAQAAVYPDRARARSDVRAEEGLAADAPLVCAISRLTRQKRLDILLDAWERVVRTTPEARLLIVGRGELEAELRARAAKIPGNTVRFPGFREDLGRILAASDAFAMSSDWEGVPVVILQAMAAGTPLVATAVSGIGDAVRNGIDGLLVPPRDPEALARALLSVLTDRPAADLRAAAAARRVREQYSLEASVREWESLYTRLTLPLRA